MNVLDLDIPSSQFAIFSNHSDSLFMEDLQEQFFFPLRNQLLSYLDESSSKFPHIDFDTLEPFVTELINSLDPRLVPQLRKLGYGGSSVTSSEWNKAKAHKGTMIFLWFYPHFANLLMNIHLLSSVVIRSTEIHLKELINTKNFVAAKSFIDEINRARWNRPQNTSERQSGVSNLGSVSEALLEKALNGLIDRRNFFKTNNQKVQSYGDFVLMCLPNNLWLSVKSNFARERLLASGYSTDILGVGFFTSPDEFTSPAKIRNFQRVGFLAMYLPEIPISEDQIKNNTNTYNQVVAHYKITGNLPLNINGTKFIRPLSQLHSDLEQLIDVENIANRTTINF